MSLLKILRKHGWGWVVSLGVAQGGVGSAVGAATPAFDAPPAPAAPKTAAAAACAAPLGLQRKEGALQSELAARLSEAGWQTYLDEARLAVSLVDVSRPKALRYAGINDDVMMYAASLPKIVALLAWADAAHKGRASWSAVAQNHLHEMIVASSNADAAWVTDRLGLTAMERTVRDARFCFFDDAQGGLWLGRAYRRGGPSYKDPVAGLSHAATTRQVARFFAMLHAGQLISKRWSGRMLALMAPPKHTHKFVAGLAERSDVTFLARKSGTWHTFHSDAALISRPDGRVYVAVAMADLPDGEEIMRRVIVVLDDLMRPSPP